MTPTPSQDSPPLIERARPSDLIGIRWLLDLEELPTSDLSEHSLQHFFVCRDADGVAGAVGLQRYSEVALLRSLVLTRGQMGRGLGRQLVAAAERLASELDIRAIYLLTTTAKSFFEHLGFRCIGRDQAPDVIRRTAEFTSLCPDSAILMVKP